MAETTNIGLHQWAAEDPVLRTDFNADFAKIDRAVGAIPLVKLKEVVTTQDAQQLDVDVSDIDFDLYDEVIVYAELVNTKESDSVSPYCSITINDTITGSRYGCAGSDDMNSSTTMNISYILYPGIISSGGGFYYTCAPAKIRFQKRDGCVFGRCEYGYMNRQSSYYFRSTAGLFYLGEDTFNKFSITVGNTSNNCIAAGAKLRFLGVQK